MSTHNQSPVAKINQPEEEAVVGSSSQGCYGIEALVCVLTLVHPLSSNLEIEFDKIEIDDSNKDCI